MIIGIIIGVLLGNGILCAILIPKVKHQEEINKEVRRQNSRAEEFLAEIESNIKNKQLEVSKLQEAQNRLNNSINIQKEQVNQYLETNKENINLKYNDYKNQLEKEYLGIAKDLATNATKRIKQLQDQEIEKDLEYKTLMEKYDALIESAKLEVEDMRSRVNAAVEASKRAEEMENKKDFYRIIIPKEDLCEINELRDVATHLRNAEPLYKVIWKVYYEKPTNDMIGRVVGTDKKIGIYKITNLKNGKCYVGQTSASGGFSDRWKQHIKRGLGAESATRNKLYPVMKECGVENFSFEIIEECSSEKLNEKEQYWQEYFHAKDYGYSIK